MNVRIKFPITFTAGIFYNNELQMNNYMVNLSMLTNSNDGATNTNLNMNYKADTPLLSLSAFKSCFTYLCFNIRRNGTIMDDSGDKEVGSIDALISINGTVAASTTQLMLCGLNTDSLLTVTDGGSSTSFVY